MKPTRGKSRSIYIPAEVDAEIKELTKETGRSYSKVASLLLQSAVERRKQFVIDIESKPLRKKEVR